MPPPKGNAWLNDELKERALAFINANPGCGRITLARSLGLSEYQAQTILRELRDRVQTTEENPTPTSPAVSPMVFLRHRIRVLEAENAQLMRERSVVSHLKDAFSEAIGALPAIEIPKMNRVEYKPNLDPEDVILHVSDSQVGQFVSADHTGGLGQYDYPTFCRRMARYRSNIGRILRYTPNPTPTCYLALGGDIVDGSTVFRGQQRQIDLVTVRQVTSAYEQFAVLIQDLLEMFDNVVVVSVPGNHGRIGLKGENAPHDSYDWLLTYFLEERFKRSEHANRIRWYYPETWWALFEVRGFKFLLAHGDEFKSWLNIPFYGADRYRGKMRELFHSLTGTKVDFDYVLTGHHHEAAAFHCMYLNGCWPGGSEFSLQKLQAGGIPSQNMLGVHEKRGVAWYRQVFLAERNELPQPEVFR